MDSEFPSNSRFLRLTVQFRRAGVPGQTSWGAGEGVVMQGNRMLALNTWPGLTAPITNPWKGLVCSAKSCPRIVSCPGAVGSHT